MLQKCIDGISGGSILETVVSLRNEGLVIEDAVCVLNREQGGQEYLKSEGTNLHRSVIIILSCLASRH